MSWEKSSVKQALGVESLGCSMLISAGISSRQSKTNQKENCPTLLQVFKRWIDGDVTLDLELQAALSEKTAQFAFAEITLLKALVQEHVASSEKKMVALGKTGPSIQAAQLERQAFELVLSNIAHDLNVYQVFFNRHQDRESSVYFQQVQHKQARKAAANDVAKKLCDRTSALWKVKMCNLESPNVCVQEFQAMRSQVMKCESLQQKDQVLVLVMVNLAAPSTYTSQQQTCQATLTGSLVNAEGALASLLTPVWFHKKGHLFKLEETANKLLSGANVNCDSRFAIPFTGKNDEREKRSVR